AAADERPAAQRGICLWLLYFYPDQVHRPPLRGPLIRGRRLLVLRPKGSSRQTDRVLLYARIILTAVRSIAMDMKQQIKWQLQTIRQFDEQFLPALKSPADWTHQVFPGSNHALWVVGHLAMVDNNVLAKLFPEKSTPKPGWSEKFGRQSKPSPNSAD